MAGVGGPRAPAYFLPGPTPSDRFFFSVCVRCCFLYGCVQLDFRYSRVSLYASHCFGCLSGPAIRPVRINRQRNFKALEHLGRSFCGPLRLGCARVYPLPLFVSGSSLGPAGAFAISISAVDSNRFPDRCLRHQFFTGAGKFGPNGIDFKVYFGR